MAVSFTFSNHYKYQLLKQLIDLGADSIKAVLCKSGFVFDPDTHSAYSDLKHTTGSLLVAFDATSKTISRASGSFVTDGFVTGMEITTTSGTNDGPFTLTNVTALVLTVSETVVTETITCAITVDDEVLSGGGYTQDTKTLTNVVVTEDDTGDRCHLVCADLSWTGEGDGFVTAGCMLFDDTPAADADKTIMGYLNFDGDVTISADVPLPIKDIVLDITGTASGAYHSVTLSNHFLFQMANGEIDLSSDTFKFILMATGYTFNKDTHATYANVSASELGTGNGYIQDTTTLSNPVVTEDDVGNLAKVVFDTVVITASGGSIGPTPGAIIYDDTSSDNTVVGFWQLQAEKTAVVGETHTFVGITIENI